MAGKEAGRLILEDRKQLLRALLERARDLRRKAQEKGPWDPLEELLRDRYGEKSDSA